jgi:transcriptional regulator with XRE-family HTH domain
MSQSRAAVGTIKAMDDRRIGRILRAVRQRRGLRQSDVAATIGVGQTMISRLERGRLESVGLATLRRVAMELDVSITISANWRGGQGDRLLDRAHAAIVDHVIKTLTELEWEIVPEFSFNHFGDRGSVDVLAWHPGRRILLIIEVKATLTDLQDLLVSLSRKLRVVPDIVRESLGWDADHVARIVVVASTAANRSIVARHAATFDASFPARSREVSTWLRRPFGALAGVWFVSTSSLGTGMSVARTRIRRTSRRRA